ncbi:MAG: SusC/RagA family TonB-linked outer rane protein [Bacteroidetes bacterium]|nr:SusC/RagA family TonB-linked outer rane protein [Bacteroidota bacterium]
MRDSYTVRVLLGFLLLVSVLAVQPLSAQEARKTYTITGTVVDAKTSEPLVGANITIRGTTLGAASKTDGKYSILATLPRGTYRVAHSFLGYRTKNQEVQLGEAAIVEMGRVALDDDPLQIQEVVVTGTGTAMEKERLGNSIGTVTRASITDSRAPTVDAALIGKITGALVQQNSGTPGGGVSVRLRGTSTISGSAEPLYIIDGTIVDNSSNEIVNLGGYVGNRIADLNPNDIDRIEVVKGAAAAALYGSRANNGVIQIFTKRGQLGTPRVTFRTQAGTSEIRKTYEVNMYPFDRPPTDPLRKAVTRRDYQKDIFRTGYQNENYISLSGGSEATKYYIGGTYGNETGIVQATSYQKVNFRANLDQILGDWLKLSVGANYIYSYADRVPNGGIVGGEGVITNFAFQPNWFDLSPNAEGKYPTPPNAGFANELEVMDRWKNPDRVNRFIGGLQLTGTPLSNLSMEYRVGLDQYRENANRQMPIGSSAGYLTGFSQQATQDVLLVNNDITATHTMSMSDFGFTTVAGFSHQYYEGTNITASVRDLIPVATILSSGATALASEFREKRVIYGSFVQETIGFQEKIFLTGGIRVDGASTFSADDRFQMFPKASLSYILSNESFWKENVGSIVNRFKFRTAWGQSGGQPAGTYDRFSVYVQQSNSNRPGLVNAVLLGNQKLKPERMTEIEVGGDIGLFEDLVSIEATYYQKKVSDLLLQRTLAPSTGFSGILDNVGELDNKGYELMVKGVVWNSDQFQWLSTLTISHNQNKVTKLNGPAFAAANSFGIGRVAEGEPLGFFYGPKYQRNTDGSIKYDTLGRPLRDPVAQKIGDPNPSLVLAFVNNFEIFRNLTVHVQFDGIFGQDVFNFTRRILETPAFGNGKEYEKELSGQVAVGYFNSRRTIFEEYVEDGSFVKLREFSVSYRLDQDFFKSLGMRSLEVTLTGRNLLSFDNYQGYDPEVNAASQSTLVRGFDWSTTPLPRSWILSLTFNL